MSREIVNLIVAELPGTDKTPEGGWDVWSAADRPFARVADDAVEVRADAGWEPVVAADDVALRDRLVEAYERLRDRLPPEEQPRLDRTSG